MSRSRITTRPSVRIGPARVAANIGTKGLNSVTVRALGLSFNIPVSATARRSRSAGLSSVDLPGPISYRTGR